MRKLPINKDFDLATIHLEGSEHYVPPKARHAYEIARRRELRPGTLVAEYERKGLLIAAAIIRHLVQPKDLKFASDILGASGLNSSWYNFARDAEVMRRRLNLTMLSEEDRDYQPDIRAVMHGAIGELGNAASFADMYMSALRERSPSTNKYRRTLGRVLGNASLTVTCLGFGPEGLASLATRPDDLVQQAVRRRGLYVLNQAQVLTDQLGTAPSLAQLADPDSDLSVFWRRNAPTGAYDALELAVDSVVA